MMTTSDNPNPILPLSLQFFAEAEVTRATDVKRSVGNATYSGLAADIEMPIIPTGDVDITDVDDLPTSDDLSTL